MATLVSWKSRLESGMAICCLSDESKFCLNGSDRPRDVMFRSVFVHDTHVPCQASWCRGLWITTRGYIRCFGRVKKTVPATLHRLLIPFNFHFFDRNVMCFFSGTTHIHITAATTQRAFSRVQQLPCPARAQISHQSNTYGTYEAGTYCFSRACHNHCRIQRITDAWDNLSQDDIRHHCMREYTLALLPEEGTLCIDVTIWHAPLTVKCVFHLVWICYHITYSYNDKLSGTSIVSTMNLSLRVLHLFPAVYLTSPNMKIQSLLSNGYDIFATLNICRNNILNNRQFLKISVH